MAGHIPRGSCERPLLGAVVCCTSIPPEDRTRLAEYAQQMGAEHKLDLTSDVTHLIVGSTNTPKYAYVAREREDVRVLKPEWIEALRQLWMEDRKIDLNLLDAQYRVEAFAGLRICITGFDDLVFRSKLADNVKQNGGEYYGDLTKNVTHLIAANTEGKKYEYATMWGKKVVSLNWYKDSLERGMQLPEETYHPTISTDQQGAGAWNRQARQQLTSTKRANDDAASQEPTRKLRRTASARLSGQADNIWGDIVGGGDVDGQPPARDRDVLRPSKSMSSISRPTPEVPPFDSKTKTNATALGPNKQDPKKYLHGAYITIRDFGAKQSKILRDVLDSLGATVFDDVPDLITDEDVDSSNSFILVPYTSRPATLPYLKRSSIRPTLVSELWLEQCMTRKQLVAVEDYPLGGVIADVKKSDFEGLVVNATGFESITTLHISKIIALTGAQYSETFSNKCSLLIANTSQGHDNSAQKRGAAREWKVPIVTEKWLWHLVRSGDAPPPSMQLSSKADEDDNDIHQQSLRKRKHAANRDDPGSNSDRHLNRSTSVTKYGGIDRPSLNDGKLSTKDPPSNVADKDTDSDSWSIISRPAQPPSGPSLGSRNNSSDGVLIEISPNSPTKSGHGQPSKTRQAVKVYDGTFDSKENEIKDAALTILKRLDSQKRFTSPEKSAQDALAMNSAIQDLLEMKAKAKAVAQKAEQDASGKVSERTFLERALSNLSNSSRTSNPRQSRASSIDSLNTDGVGSELAAPSGLSRNNTDTLNSESRVPKRTNSMSLTGRATRKPSATVIKPPIDLTDPNLCRDEYADDTAPPLTQLGYEDSEEAIALREKLAERRRARSRKSTTTNPADESLQPKSAKKPERQVLRDDETMLAIQNDLGWGGKRRLRERKKDENEEMMF